jgi:hypothetical protein
VRNRRPSQFRRLERAAGCDIIVRQRTTVAANYARARYDDLKAHFRAIVRPSRVPELQFWNAYRCGASHLDQGRGLVAPQPAEIQHRIAVARRCGPCRTPRGSGRARARPGSIKPERLLKKRAALRGRPTSADDRRVRSGPGGDQRVSKGFFYRSKDQGNFALGMAAVKTALASAAVTGRGSNCTRSAQCVHDSSCLPWWPSTVWNWSPMTRR